MPKLTKTVVDGLQAPATGDLWVWDTELEGFGVRVQASGRKTYVIRYRAPDAKRTQRKMTIARCSDLPPDRARDQARKVFAQVAEGQDPVGEAKPAPTSKATVERMFQGYVAHMRKKGRISADEVERMLLQARHNAADALGRERPVVEVTPADIVDYVSRFYDAGHRGAADKARSYVASAFAWAITSANDYTTKDRQDWGLERNPAADVAKDTGAITTRDRNLAADEMRELWQATEIGTPGFSIEMAAAIRMMICCGQRVQETLRIEGAEIDLGAALWRMPAHKSKIKRQHTIPLPRQAVEVLRDLISRHGDGPLFPGRVGYENEKASHRSVNQAIRRWLRRRDVNVPAFQARDLRRTWKSRAHDAGIDRFTRDLIQQHAKNDTGSKNYDRADYLPQMREAMAKWSRWLDAVVDGGAVQELAAAE
jgi:integrase